MANELATTKGTSIAQIIKANHKAISSVLPKHMDPNRMARLAVAEARRNPDLLKADPQSFIGALIQAAQLGLEPGIAGLGYLIPRWNGRLQCNEVQFQAGYKGLLRLARNSGEVGAIMADVVREGDEFTYSKGTDPYLTHKPSTGDRGEVTHVYCVAHLFKSGDWQFEVMTVNEVEKVRTMAKAKSGPWVSHWESMAKKTVARRLMTWIPSSVEIMTAMAAEESGEVDGEGSRVYAPDLDLPTTDSSASPPTKLADRFAGAEEADVEDLPDGPVDDWDLLEFDDLAKAVEPFATKRLKTKKAFKDMVARGDKDGLVEMARKIVTTE